MSTLNIDDQRGAAALLVAGSLVAIFGFAALAVDMSGFYQTARVNQTTADLACLAGAAELDSSDSDAIDMAVDYTKTNWPDMAGATLTVTGATSAALADGSGNSVTYETQHNGQPDQMLVTVTKRDPTTFGKVVGSQSVQVTQQAACERNLELGGAGALPMGALPGAFNGNLFDCAAKVSGNCGALDVGSGASDWRSGIGDGWDQRLQKHHGDEGDADPDTGVAVVDCPSPGPCSANATETGNMAGPFRQGTGDRLSKVAGADCVIDGNFNCDSMAQVFGTAPQTLDAAFGGTAPGWWEESLYGAFSAVSGSQYFFNGDIEKCDSPRLATVPIVAWDLDWDIGDDPGTWPNGKKDMKVVGFYIVYIREPDTPEELGSGPIVGDVVHLGSGATCDGQPYDPFATGVEVETVRLVQP